ncbi:MAG: MlaD family protein [Thermoleophilaceae bacterium]
MRRVTAILLVCVALPTGFVLGLGGSGEDDGYRLRAIFDNAAAAVPGEDVKVAGARVGVIESMEVTPGNKAAMVLLIEEPGFDRFRADASCTIRPQSLIGEKFVECEPGSTEAPPLREIPDGEDGEGQHLLPLENTSSPVDLDLVNNVLRRPFRERLSLVLAELGTGVAGRGEELNEVIHRANPALRETDRVLEILADQNDVLADLARDSDAALAPLARERRRVSSFIGEANATAEATAERRDDIERSVQRLPRLLPELRSTLAELGSFSDEATPLLRDARAAAPDVNRLLREIGPFSRASIPALESLGEATDVGGPALDRSRPLLADLRDFAGDLRPLSLDLDELTESLDATGAIERAMDYLFFQVTAINGFDGISHYLRAGLIVNTCSVYAIEPVAGCSANFTDTRAVRGATASSRQLDPRLADTRRVLRGAEPKAAGDAEPVERKDRPAADPKLEARREEGIERIRKGAERPAPRNGTEQLLDYLLGSGG